MARWLHRLRVDSGLSLREAAARLGASSSEAWARYESGRASPTMDKLSELVRAVEPDADFMLRKVTLKKAG
ncbi:MAG TPA: helix-turn-helix transcriptional regulator [Steroidobacteraceae bacterium]|nr:helix-turn-helix transcriptional regulator [Steroidobacteraceae bacterium]